MTRQKGMRPSPPSRRFSVDWPFEDIGHGATWFDQADISENDRRKIGRDNAARLFKLKL